MGIGVTSDDTPASFSISIAIQEFWNSAPDPWDTSIRIMLIIRILDLVFVIRIVPGDESTIRIEYE
jgi:hypothetical protein